MAAFVSGPVPVTFEREITASPAEFERDLRRAWAGGVDTIAPRRLRVADGGTRLDLHIETRGVRRLGLFELPVIVVQYRFSDVDEPARRRLLVALDRAMQRGGG